MLQRLPICLLIVIFSCFIVASELESHVEIVGDYTISRYCNFVCDKIPYITAQKNETNR